MLTMELKSNLIQMRVGGRIIHMRRMTSLTMKEWQQLEEISDEARKAMKVVEFCIVNSDEGVGSLFENMTLEEFGRFVEEWTELHNAGLDG